MMMTDVSLTDPSVSVKLTERHDQITKASGSAFTVFTCDLFGWEKGAHPASDIAVFSAPAFPTAGARLATFGGMAFPFA